MRMKSFSTLLLFFLPCFWLQSANCLIPCPLVWVDHSSGHVISDTIVGPGGGSYGPEAELPARVWSHASNQYHGGSMQQSIAKYSINETAQKTGNYQLLTNPHSCIVKWVQVSNLENDEKEYLVKIDKSQSNLIGRAIIESQVFYGDVSDGKLSISRKENEHEILVQYQLLVSYSSGLAVQMKHFKFLNENIQGKKEYLGQDEIINDSDSEIRETVRISKRIRERTSMETSSSFSIVNSIKISLDASFDIYGVKGSVGLPFSFGISFAFSKESNSAYEIERDFIVEREVIVPKNTAVKVTSEIVMIDNFSSSYEAVAEYSAPGLSADEILDILNTNGIKNGIKDESRNLVILISNGVISGSMAAFNQFNIEQIFV